MIAQTLSQILSLNARLDVPFEPGTAQEGMCDYFARLKDELLWPRILVRHAPPPDEIQPIAPDRF